MIARKLIYFIFAIGLLVTGGFPQTQDAPSAGDLETRIVKRFYDDVNEKQRWEVKAHIPELRLKGDSIAEGFIAVATEMVMKHVADFKKTMAGFTEEDRKRLPEKVGYYLEIDYSIEHLSDEFVSVNFVRSEYTGGAHPNHWSFTLNYDLKNDRAVALENLFKPNSNFLKIVSENSIRQILKKQGEYPTEDWVRRGAGEKIENFKIWNMTKAGLKFTFDPYQVGSYAEGPYETLVPYEQFPRAIQSLQFFRVAQASYLDGNPPNWCRNGHFPGYDVEFQLATIKGKRGEAKQRAYFYRDDDTCPDGANCREKKYVIPGDEVIVAKNYGDFSCVWYQPTRGAETVGWLKTSDLEIIKAPVKPGRINWIGDWGFGESDIKFAAEKTLGDLRITGTSFWKGAGDNIHIGELDFSGTPKDNKLEAGTGAGIYDCRVKMQRVGKYLIVSDNKNCGGVNVTFDGVYRKK